MRPEVRDKRHPSQMQQEVGNTEVQSPCGSRLQLHREAPDTFT